MNRTDFQKLSRIRVREARTLLREAAFQGAYYLSGYAVECALKACICKRFGRHEFPERRVVNDSYTHDLGQLLNVSGLRQTFEQALGADTDLAENWDTVKDWSEDARYRTSITSDQAKELYRACTARRNGLLSWLRVRW